jgi:hypothetical protein
MQKNKNRKGLALGAIFALVASTFASLPAQANESAVVVFPTTGLETQTTMLADEAFDLSFRFGNNVPDVLRNPAGANVSGFGFIISKPAGVTVSATVSQSVNPNANGNDNNISTQSLGVFSNTMSATYNMGVESSKSPRTLVLSLPGRTSVSPAVAVVVTPFLDLNKNGIRDNGETLGDAITVNFVPWTSAFNASINLRDALVGDLGVTASFQVSNPALNWAQLDHNFTFGVGTTGESTGTITVNPAAPAFASGGFSASHSITPGTAFAAATPPNSTSATLNYKNVLLAESKKAVIARTITGVTFSGTVGANLIHTGTNANSADARLNSAFALTVRPHTNNATFSTIATAVVELRVALTTGTWPANATVTINGVLHTSSATLPTASRPVVLAAGSQALSVATTGFAGAEVFTFTGTSQLFSNTYAVRLMKPDFRVSDLGSGYWATAPGTAVTLDLEVKDQFGEYNNFLIHRVSASAVLVGSVSPAATAAVVNGKATVAVTPAPATRTGSAKVTVTVEQLDQLTNIWSATGNTAVEFEVSVTDTPSAFTVSPTAEVSASISYDIELGKYSWSEVITGSTIVAGAVVTVAGEGLVFTWNNGTTTASDSLTFRSGKDGAFSVRVAGTKAGDHNVIFTTGAVAATTVLTIDPALSSAGVSKQFSGVDGFDWLVTPGETALPSSTLIYEGFLTDKWGNPVAGAMINITTLGPVNLIPIATTVTTDVDGEFLVRFQQLSNDDGKGVSVTATYFKNGVLTAPADQFSIVHMTEIQAPLVITADAVTVTGSASVLTGLSTDVTVTVVDADGKPLAGRNVSLRSTGPGFLNVQSAVSDTDGNVVVKFIATAQVGQVVITAIVDGKVGTHTLTVAAPVVVVPEINAVIGSFNGRWAVRVENAKGAVVSVKVGNNWFKFTALNDNYLFSRASRVGATLPIAVYVNGQLENVATITIK